MRTDFFHLSSINLLLCGSIGGIQEAFGFGMEHSHLGTDRSGRSVTFSKMKMNLAAKVGDDGVPKQVLTDVNPEEVLESLDEQGIGYEVENPFATPKEMEYKPVNIRRQQKYFEEIRMVGGSECVNDIYARDNGAPDKRLKQTFWFVGKVARCTGTVSLAGAVGRQWNLIEEHAARLRHVELGPSFKDMRFEIWAAPGDSEMQMAQNRLSASLQKMQRMEKSEWESIAIDEIGWDGELQDGDEGFRVLRSDDGLLLSPQELSNLESS